MIGRVEAGRNRWLSQNWFQSVDLRYAVRGARVQQTETGGIVGNAGTRDGDETRDPGWGEERRVESSTSEVDFRLGVLALLRRCRGELGELAGESNRLGSGHVSGVRQHRYKRLQVDGHSQGEQGRAD